jgi:hypothetical protein
MNWLHQHGSYVTQRFDRIVDHVARAMRQVGDQATDDYKLLEKRHFNGIFDSIRASYQ